MIKIKQDDSEREISIVTVKNMSHIHTIFIALLLSMMLYGQDDIVSVPYYTQEAPISPIAHTLGDLPYGHNAFAHSANFTSELLAPQAPHSEAMFTWQVRNLDGLDGWAVCRFFWTVPYPADGIEIEFAIHPAVSKITTEYFINCSYETKSFWTAKAVVKQHNIALTPQTERQTVRVMFTDLKVPEDVRRNINAIGFAVKAASSMSFYRISLLYRDKQTASEVTQALAERKQRELTQDQDTMLQALSLRGIDSAIIAEEHDPLQREALLWTGWTLLAQERQIDFFNALTKSQAPQLCHPEYAVENSRLQADLATHGIHHDSQAVVRLQTHIETWLDQILSAIPHGKRRFTLGPDKRFYDPSGRPYRFYGPFFFRAMWDSALFISWKKEDIRYLAGLGFNGLRLYINYKELEPERGVINQRCIERCRAIMREAERYGLGVSIDLHWPYPDWFLAGKPGFEHPAEVIRNPQNSYRWDDALVETWRRIGQAFKDCPNIVAFEVPTNETPLANDPAGLTAFPELMAEWNDWLKAAYNNSRQALADAWGQAIDNPQKYGLQPHEDWNRHTILPMGFQNEEDFTEVGNSNPRLQDYLRFAAWKQRTLSGRIVAALRESIPQAVGMFQRTIGDIWDNSPTPLDYRAILTCVGDHVLVGTHYNMGGLQAEKANTLAMGSYDSEQQMENNSHAVHAHVQLGNGFSPFAFDNVGGGGMLFSGHNWHLKPSVLHLMRDSDYIRNAWPPVSTAPRIAIITNSRLEALEKESIYPFVKTLRETGYQPKVFESMRIADEPELLQDIPLVITTSSYLDTRLLTVLKNSYKGQVLFYGRLDIDAYASSLVPILKHHNLFIDNAKYITLENHSNIDLSGSWYFTPVPNASLSTPMRAPAAGELTTVIKKQVPKKWGETGMTGSLRYFIGDAWMWRQFRVPKKWPPINATLHIGAIDDLDWVWINGHFIGSTTEETPEYWLAKRTYPIPMNILKPGTDNLLVVGVRNLREDGGIYRGPVVIHAAQDTKAREPLRCNLPKIAVTADSLRKDVDITASMEVQPGIVIPLKIRQGRFSHVLTESPLNLLEILSESIISVPGE